MGAGPRYRPGKGRAGSRARAGCASRVDDAQLVDLEKEAVPMNANGPLLAIRADAGHQMGIGHVMRTLAIAQCWQARGGRVAYLSITLPEPLAKMLIDRAIAVVRIDAERDAESTTMAMARMKAQVLLVDHYGLPDDWWRSLPATRRWRTAALNDFMVPIHTMAEVLVSPRVVSITDHLASGSDYLLIRDELRRADSGGHPVLGAARRVLVVLGGSDPLGIAPTTAKWLLAESKDILVRVIEGPAAKSRAQLNALSAVDPRLEVVVTPVSMRPHYEWADTAICSPSTTVFEALHHGLVTGLVVTTDNQTEVAKELLDQCVALQIADARSVVFSPDRAAWAALANNMGTRRELSSSGLRLVDGKGAERVCDLIGLPVIRLRSATVTDTRLLFDWSNDPITRAASFSGAPIHWENHEPWMISRLGKSDPFWIAEEGHGVALAVIRFDLGQNQTASISFNLSPNRRGAGLSSLILERACLRFREIHPHVPIHAWIKPNNEASLRCFKKAGFVEAPSPQPDRKLYVQLS